jgi:virginiamycin B lyase
MRTQIFLTLTTAALFPLVLAGCGDLTDGGQSATLEGQAIGSLALVSKSPTGLGFTHVAATPRVVSTAGTGKIGPVKVTYFDLADNPVAPDAVTIGPDGAPWYSRAGELVRVASDDSVSKVPMPSGAGFAPALVAARGSLWLANWEPNQGVVRVDPTTGEGTLFSIPSPLARPTAITADRHGDIWVTGGDQPVVGRFDAHDGVFVVAQELAPQPVTVSTAGIAVTAGGAVFMSDYSEGRIGRVHGSDLVWTDLGGNSHAPSGMAAAADGSIWFVDLGGRQVGRIDAAGKVHTYALPPELQNLSDKSAGSIAAAPDGTLWFTVPEADSVVRVTSAGDIAYVSLEQSSLPRGLAIDAHCAIWVTTLSMARIELGH